MNIPQKTLSLFSATFLIVASSLSAVTTDPVGYITVTINGNGGSGDAFTYLGVPLHKAVVASGALDTAPTAHSLTDTSQSWTVDEYSGAYVMITSGVNEGVSATISSNTSDTLTTSEDLSSLLAGNETFEIRPYTTIADVFGATNSAGLDGGSTAGNADTILIQAGAGFDTYYYKDAGFLGGTGWRSSANPSIDESNTVIPFGTGIIVVRKQTDDIDLVISGSVFGGDAITPIEEDFNWKAPSIPVGLTLNGLFGPENEAGLDGGSAAGNADNVVVPTASGLTTYYYKNAGFLGGTGWRSSASPSVDEGDTVFVQPGQMFLINRTGGAGFNLAESSPL